MLARASPHLPVSSQCRDGAGCSSLPFGSFDFTAATFRRFQRTGPLDRCLPSPVAVARSLGARRKHPLCATGPQLCHSNLKPSFLVLFSCPASLTIARRHHRSPSDRVQSPAGRDSLPLPDLQTDCKVLLSLPRGVLCSAGAAGVHLYPHGHGQPAPLRLLPAGVRRRAPSFSSVLFSFVPTLALSLQSSLLRLFLPPSPRLSQPPTPPSYPRANRPRQAQRRCCSVC